MHLGLSRIRSLLDALGNPQSDYPSIHIAGTNGKGSVAALTESILRSAGHHTGLYTSPHLERPEERIRISGKEISSRRFVSAAQTVQLAEQDLLRRKRIDRPLTYFEFLTACAFLQFARERVDVAVVEVGLGGRLDATNVLRPECCIITTVSHDHESYLGKTIRKIAREKAGIIKSAIPVISGCRKNEARKVVRETARRRRAPLMEVDRDCEIRIRSVKRGFATVSLKTAAGQYGPARVALAGRHQSRNAAMAVAAVEALSSLEVSRRAVERGLASARWPGRLETYRSRRRTLLDGSHNPEAARLLREHVQECVGSEIHLVFGVMRDKNIRKLGSILFPLAAQIYLTPVSNERGASPSEIAALHPRHRKRMRLFPDARAALLEAWSQCPARGTVLVTGSFYLVGELLPTVRKYSRPRPRDNR